MARALQLGPLSLCLCKNNFLMTETWRSLSIRGSVAADDSFPKVLPILGTIKTILNYETHKLINLTYHQTVGTCPHPGIICLYAGG